MKCPQQTARVGQRGYIMTVNIRSWSELDDDSRKKLFARSETDIAEITPAIAEIIDAVRNRGDEALREYNHRFDKAPLEASIRVPESHFADAEASLSENVKKALEYSVENVRRYHADQNPDGLIWKEIRPGIMAGERTRPIDSVAFYVPRARGSFPSMLYMMAVPASIAGVGRIALASPPDKEGRVDAACLYVAKICGIDEVYAVGGSQAWAALAYGTESVRKVDKCMGPGSKYIAAAKRLLSDVLDCGLPAGPSESIILADATPDPRLVAQDLLIEAEHGSDSAALLITPSKNLAVEVGRHLIEMAKSLPEPRQTFVTDVFSGYGGILLVKDLEEGIDLTNRFATEHLQIRTEDPFAILGRIRNAGEILLGEYAPFSAANYSVGANAILPTGGNARTWSGISVADFKKKSSVVYLTKEGLDDLRPHAAALAEYEEFPAHKRALIDR